MRYASFFLLWWRSCGALYFYPFSVCFRSRISDIIYSVCISYDEKKSVLLCVGVVIIERREQKCAHVSAVAAVRVWAWIRGVRRESQSVGGETLSVRENGAGQDAEMVECPSVRWHQLLTFDPSVGSYSGWITFPLRMWTCGRQLAGRRFSGWC